MEKKPESDPGLIIWTCAYAAIATAGLFALFNTFKTNLLNPSCAPEKKPVIEQTYRNKVKPNTQILRGNLNPEPLKLNEELGR